MAARRRLRAFARVAEDRGAVPVELAGVAVVARRARADPARLAGRRAAETVVTPAAPALLARRARCARAPRGTGAPAVDALLAFVACAVRAPRTVGRGRRARRDDEQTDEEQRSSGNHTLRSKQRNLQASSRTVATTARVGERALGMWHGSSVGARGDRRLDAHDPAQMQMDRAATTRAP